jgi:hypothetical protein
VRGTCGWERTRVATTGPLPHRVHGLKIERTLDRSSSLSALRRSLLDYAGLLSATLENVGSRFLSLQQVSADPCQFSIESLQICCVAKTSLLAHWVGLRNAAFRSPTVEKRTSRDHRKSVAADPERPRGTLNCRTAKDSFASTLAGRRSCIGRSYETQNDFGS